jgi:hypothetical protein
MGGRSGSKPSKDRRQLEKNPPRYTSLIFPSSINKTRGAKSRNVLDNHEHVLFSSLAIEDVIKNSPENNRLSIVFAKRKPKFCRNKGPRQEKAI